VSAGLPREERTLQVAEQVHEILARRGIKAAVIGAMALAVHLYPRSTEDFDLGTSIEPFIGLRDVERDIRRAGFETDFRIPDAEDPLGGVIDVVGPDFDLIQIVNFWNPLSGRLHPGMDAVTEASRGYAPQSGMKVVDLPYLIAMKLHAGGHQNRHDVGELLQRNQPLDRARIREVCARYGLEGDLDRILAEMGL
jgi:hypothetical protein